MKPAQLAFFKNFLVESFETALLNGQIGSVVCERLKSWCEKPEARDYAHRLFTDKIVEVKEHHIRLQLKTLREINGRYFPHIEVYYQRKKRRPKRVCFVGHRFVP
jgi:hypothetical protein